MRFVPIKEADQRAVLMLHRTRELLIRQRVMLVNAARAHAAEFGPAVPMGIQRIPELCALIASADPDQPFAIGLRQDLQHGFCHGTQEIAPAALLQQLDKRHSIFDHRVLGGSGVTFQFPLARITHEGHGLTAGRRRWGRAFRGVGGAAIRV